MTSSRHFARALSICALLAGLGPAAAGAVTLTAYSGPTCSGSYVYVLPELPIASGSAGTTGSDAPARGPGNQSGPFQQLGGASSGATGAQRASTVTLSNLDSANSAAVTVCGYASGSFLGGTSLTLGANNQLLAIDPTPSTTTATTIGLSSLLNGADLTGSSKISLVVAADRPIAAGAIFGAAAVGALRTGEGSYARSDLAFPNVGRAATDGVLVVSNPGATTASFTLSFYQADGTLIGVSATQTASAYQSQRITLAGLTDSGGAALTLTNAATLHVISSTGVLGGNLFPGSPASGHVGSAPSGARQ